MSIEVKPPVMQPDQDRLVAALAHRVCHAAEHDPANGKLHGCCVVDGEPWPCDTARAFLVSPPVMQHHAATTTPDLDLEKVRRALETYDPAHRREWHDNFGVLWDAAREYLRLREQPAADVQAHCGDQRALFSQAEIKQLTAAAVAREREEQQVAAAAFRLLRDEADAADAWHAETGMKVARPPRMSPATVKHIRDAEIRARSAKVV